MIYCFAALVFGMLLAQFFRVFVMLPALVLASGGAIVMEAAGGSSIVNILASALCVTISLQLGFCLGIVIRGKSGLAVDSDEETPLSVAETELDKALAGLQEKLAAMRSAQSKFPEEAIAYRGHRSAS